MLPLPKRSARIEQFDVDASEAHERSGRKLPPTRPPPRSRLDSLQESARPPRRAPVATPREPSRTSEASERSAAMFFSNPRASQDSHVEGSEDVTTLMPQRTRQTMPPPREPVASERPPAVSFPKSKRSPRLPDEEQTQVRPDLSAAVLSGSVPPSRRSSPPPRSSAPAPRSSAPAPRSNPPAPRSQPASVYVPPAPPAYVPTPSEVYEVEAEPQTTAFMQPAPSAYLTPPPAAYVTQAPPPPEPMPAAVAVPAPYEAPTRIGPPRMMANEPVVAQYFVGRSSPPPPPPNVPIGTGRQDPTEQRAAVRLEKPATVFFSRDKDGRPTISWVAVFVALGVLGGLIIALVVRGDSDVALDEMAKFIDTPNAQAAQTAPNATSTAAAQQAAPQAQPQPSPPQGALTSAQSPRGGSAPPASYPGAVYPQSGYPAAGYPPGQQGAMVGQGMAPSTQLGVVKPAATAPPSRPPSSRPRSVSRPSSQEKEKQEKAEKSESAKSDSPKGDSDAKGETAKSEAKQDKPEKESKGRKKDEKGSGDKDKEKNLAEEAKKLADQQLEQSL